MVDHERKITKPILKRIEDGEVGREARVLGVESTPDIDIAVFRFLDNDQSTRRVPVRRFLLDFVKVEEPPGVLPFHSWGAR